MQTIKTVTITETLAQEVLVLNMLDINTNKGTFPIRHPDGAPPFTWDGLQNELANNQHEHIKYSYQLRSVPVE